MKSATEPRRFDREPVRLSLKAKLSAGFLAVTICCAAIAGALVDRNVRRTMLAAFEDRLSYETTMLSQMTATALFGEIDPTDTSLDASIHELGKAVHTELSVIAKDGTVVADSDAADLRALGSQGLAPEIVQARETGRGMAVRGDRMYVARSIVRDGRTLGFARSSVPMSEVNGYVLGVRQRMAYGSGVALVVAVLLGLAFSSRLVRPILALSDGARRVGAGDFAHRIDVRTKDEIGELAASFNEMTRNLHDTVELLDGRNSDMRIVLDNVTQGLLTIDRSGAMAKEKSAIVEKWFGAAPEGTDFVEYIRGGDSHAADRFALQWGQMLEGVLPMELLLDQLPKRLVRGEQLFELSFTPIFEERRNQRLDKLLIVISDVTMRVVAERAEAEQREVACILERATRDKSGVLDFLLNAEVEVRQLTSEQRPALAETKRTLHTLKGNCAIFGLQRISALCHEIETRMQDAAGDIAADDIAALGHAWSGTASRLSALLGNSAQVVIDDDEYAAVLRAILDGTGRTEVARMVGEWRMERVSDRFDRFAEHIRELAHKSNKRINVDVSAVGLRLPREEWTQFWAGLVHSIRNAVDHGIEPEDERERLGKPRAGRIRLAASRRNGSVLIEIADDGRGIDWEVIAARAGVMGLPTKRHEDLVSALFVDGLSSKREASEMSGRGIGLAALEGACRHLGGSITVDSQPGHGTAFRFTIPIRESAATLYSQLDTKRPASALAGG